MTEDATRPDPAAVEAEVRRVLGAAYNGSPEARYRATVTPEARMYAEVAQRLAEIRADAVDELAPDGVRGAMAAAARLLGIKRQRIEQLKASARARRADSKKGAPAEA